MARNNLDPDRVGAVSIQKRGAAWWWWALAALVGLVVLALLGWAIWGNGDDAGGDEVTATEETEGTPDDEAQQPDDQSARGGAGAPGTTTGEGGGGAAGTATITAGGQAVLPGSEANLTRFVGEPVVGRGAQVQAVPADEAFYVGPSPQNVVFVHLQAQGESPANVQPGETVSFEGTMKAVPPEPLQMFPWLTRQEAEQLRQQGAYIEATQLTSA